MSVRQIAISLILVFGLLGGVYSFKTSLANQAETKKRRPSKTAWNIETTRVVSSASSKKIIEYGHASSIEKVDISAEVQGKIQRGDLQLLEGAKFKRGTRLFSIDSKVREYSVRSLKNDYINAINSVLPDLKLDYGDSYKNWENYAKGLKVDAPLPLYPESSSSQETNFISANNIYKLYNTIQSEQELLKKHHVYAPFHGSIQKVNFKPGSSVNPGSTVLTLIRTDLLEISVPLDKDIAKQLKVGDSAKVIVSDSKSIKGHVVRVSDFISQKNQTMTVYVAVHNASDQGVYDGDYLAVQFDNDSKNTETTVPRSSIVFNDKVFVINQEDSTLVLTQVNLIDALSDKVAIKGLAPNTLIANDPPTNAYNGMKVIFQP